MESMEEFVQESITLFSLFEPDFDHPQELGNETVLSLQAD